MKPSHPIYLAAVICLLQLPGWAETITNFCSPLVSLQYQQSPAVAPLTNVVSPIASLQFGQSFNCESLTNVLSPLASLQFNQSVGADLTPSNRAMSTVLSLQFGQNLAAEILTNGSASSHPASFYFYAAPGFATIFSSSDPLLVHIQFSAPPEIPYVLQMATNLAGPVAWQACLTNIVDSDGIGRFVITNASADPECYYRIVAP